MLRASLLYILVLLVFLSGCTSVSQSSWQVKTGSRSDLAFSGKGSAAGLMMDAYMPGGMAIGIAIDEGIAKTIAENLSKRSPVFDISTLVSQKLAKSSRSSSGRSCSEGDGQVVVDTYGFHTFAGEGDNATAWLKMRFVCDGKITLINYPSDFPSPKLAALNDIKTNPEIAYGLLNDAVAEVVQVWSNSVN